MDKLISSPRLKKQTTNISLESFQLFLYIEVDKEHRRHMSYTQSLIYICVDSLETIIQDLNLIDLHDIPPLRNNMTKSPLLQYRTTFQCNCTLIAVVALEILCYAQNKCFNIMQRVNIQFTFANNVPQRFIESFHQICLLVSYESLHHSRQANAKAVMEENLEKTQIRQFFILYDNINFYENFCDQRIYNRDSLIS